MACSPRFRPWSPQILCSMGLRSAGGSRDRACGQNLAAQRRLRSSPHHEPCHHQPIKLLGLASSGTADGGGAFGSTTELVTPSSTRRRPQMYCWVEM
jgi:hypothetical protein